MNTIGHAFLALYAVCLLACSDSTSSNGTSISCGVRADNFPTYDKTCTAATDCAIGVHQTDCCGSTLAIGMANAELPRFTADEQLCAAMFPRCLCPERDLAEDGQPVFGKTIAVHCQAGLCMTAVE